MNRPRNSWRYPPQYQWDSYARTPNADVRVLTGNDAPTGDPVATLWLPNPEMWRGWEMRFVYPNTPPPEPSRKLGF